MVSTGIRMFIMLGDGWFARPRAGPGAFMEWAFMEWGFVIYHGGCAQFSELRPGVTLVGDHDGGSRHWKSWVMEKNIHGGGLCIMPVGAGLGHYSYWCRWPAGGFHNKCAHSSLPDSQAVPLLF
jgi:hypothetical protein